MTDLYVLLRESLASTAGRILAVPLAGKQFDCPAEGCGARSAISLAHHADAAEWAARLNRQRETFLLLGIPFVRHISCNGGHLLFDFTDDFYTFSLQRALRELPAITNDDLPVNLPIMEEDAVKARIGYTIRRMWMLARYAKDGEEACPRNADVQRALLMVLAICEEGITKRAMELRLLAASDALLTMTHGVLPRQRPRLCKECAWVGDAAARLCALGLRRLQL